MKPPKYERLYAIAVEEIAEVSGEEPRVIRERHERKDEKREAARP